MNPSELRIGNYFQLLGHGDVRIPTGIRKKVSFLTSEGVECINVHSPLSEVYSYRDICQISLTVDMLKDNCGFTDKGYKPGYIGVEVRTKGMTVFFVLRIKNGKIIYELTDDCIVNIKYLHQLQNVFFALAEYELDIKF